MVIIPTSTPKVSKAERIYEELIQAGFDVILDDRDLSCGVKFGDADLIGYPLKVIVGDRGSDDQIEVEVRRHHEGQLLNIKELAAYVSWIRP